jgi:hypothetical protein
MTIEHSLLTGNDLHEPKGIADANVDLVYVANGAGGGEWKNAVPGYATATDGQLYRKLGALGEWINAGDFLATEDLITELADLPAPSVNVIELDPTKYYRLSGSVDLGPNSINTNGALIYGINPSVDKFTKTGGGPVFQPGASMAIKDIGIDAPTSFLMDNTGDTSGTSTIGIEGCAINCIHGGNVAPVARFTISGCKDIKFLEPTNTGGFVFQPTNAFGRFLSVNIPLCK